MIYEFNETRKHHLKPIFTSSIKQTKIHQHYKNNITSLQIVV